MMPCTVNLGQNKIVLQAGGPAADRDSGECVPAVHPEAGVCEGVQASSPQG